jgi:hypothetical protein
MEWLDEGGRDPNEGSLARSAWKNQKKTAGRPVGTRDPAPLPPGLPAAPTKGGFFLKNHLFRHQPLAVETAITQLKQMATGLSYFAVYYCEIGGRRGAFAAVALMSHTSTQMQIS